MTESPLSALLDSDLRPETMALAQENDPVYGTTYLLFADLQEWGEGIVKDGPEQWLLSISGFCRDNGIIGAMVTTDSDGSQSLDPYHSSGALATAWATCCGSISLNSGRASAMVMLDHLSGMTVRVSANSRWIIGVSSFGGDTIFIFSAVGFNKVNTRVLICAGFLDEHYQHRPWRSELALFLSLMDDSSRWLLDVADLAYADVALKVLEACNVARDSME